MFEPCCCQKCVFFQIDVSDVMNQKTQYTYIEVTKVHLLDDVEKREERGRGEK